MTGRRAGVREYKETTLPNFGLPLQSYTQRTIEIHNRVEAARNAGNKQYELTNHLGNVLSTFTDKKLALDNNSDGIVDGYLADISSQSDYYPFGMLKPGRSLNPGDYNHGFNGKEKDNEIHGTGNTYDFGARLYNSRLGRFFVQDPLSNLFASKTSYGFAENTPIWAIDLWGYAAWKVTGRWTQRTLKEYALFSKEFLKKKMEAGVRQDCADIALELLVEFAASKGLLLELRSYTGQILSSNDDKYGESEEGKKQFLQDVKDQIGAKGGSLQSNAFVVSDDDKQEGDFKIELVNNSPYHVIVLANLENKEKPYASGSETSIIRPISDYLSNPRYAHKDASGGGVYRFKVFENLPSDVIPIMQPLQFNGFPSSNDDIQITRPKNDNGGNNTNLLRNLMEMEEGYNPMLGSESPDDM